MKESKELQAIRNMRAIWGVGRVTAINLVNNGFSTIDEVRKDLSSSTSQLSGLLDWKAKIGGETYFTFGLRKRMATAAALVVSFHDAPDV
jgi:Fingers domain of DNA polymerase lambda